MAPGGDGRRTAPRERRRNRRSAPAAPGSGPIRFAPRVEQRDAKPCNITSVPRHQGQAAGLGRGRDEAIDGADAHARSPSPRDNPPPRVGHVAVHAEDATGEAREQILGEPGCEKRPAAALGHPLDAEPKLGEGHDAQLDALLVHAGKPGQHPRLGPGLDELGDHAGVEQMAPVAPRSISRGGSPRRVRAIPESLSGDDAKNSARVPLRRVRRSHSSADTTTTAFRPLRVTSCGLSDSAGRSLG